MTTANNTEVTSIINNIIRNECYTICNDLADKAISEDESILCDFIRYESQEDALDREGIEIKLDGRLYVVVKDGEVYSDEEDVPYGFSNTNDAIQFAIDESVIDLEPEEIINYWLVSDWLASRLEYGVSTYCGLNIYANIYPSLQEDPQIAAIAHNLI